MAAGSPASVRIGLNGFPLGHLGPPVDGSPADVIREIARAADSLGFDFVCAQDHVLAPRAWVGAGAAGASWFDPFVLLGSVAAVTSRVRLHTDVVVLPYRSPFVAAKAAATLDVLSGGRVTLGVAAGYLEEEFAALGAEFERRGAWTDEAIEAIKASWTAEWFSFEGSFFRAGDVALAPRPVQQPRPPVWVGGNSARALRRAVEHADGWTPFICDPARIQALLGSVDRPDGFAVSAPVRRMHTAEGGLDLDVATARVRGLAAAGVTHVRVGFAGTTLDGFLGQMDRFATALSLRE